jgi:hypothetical protein
MNGEVHPSSSLASSNNIAEGEGEGEGAVLPLPSSEPWHIRFNEWLHQYHSRVSPIAILDILPSPLIRFIVDYCYTPTIMVAAGWLSNDGVSSSRSCYSMCPILDRQWLVWDDASSLPQSRTNTFAAAAVIESSIAVVGGAKGAALILHPFSLLTKPSSTPLTGGSSDIKGEAGRNWSAIGGVDSIGPPHLPHLEYIQTMAVLERRLYVIVKVYTPLANGTQDESMWFASWQIPGQVDDDDDDDATTASADTKLMNKKKIRSIGEWKMLSSPYVVGWSTLIAIPPSYGVSFDRMNDTTSSGVLYECSAPLSSPFPPFFFFNN